MRYTNPRTHSIASIITTVQNSDKFTFRESTKQPDGTVENDAVDVEQTVLNVNGHLCSTQHCLPEFSASILLVQHQQ